MTGKKYSCAATVLGTKMLEDKVYKYNQQVAFSFMQQLSVKAAIREWGADATVASEKETNQLHWRETFAPRQMSELTDNQRSKILQSRVFIIMKRTCEIKARMIAGGNTQRGHVTKEESSSLTVFTEAVLLTSINAALDERDVAVIDIANAFIQTCVQEAKTV